MAGSIEKLIEHLSKLPGIGKKTARRLTFHLMKVSRQDALALADAVREIKDRITTCSICSNLTEEDPCEICEGPHRDRNVVCVVEEASDVMAIERVGEFRGLYHVLQGVLSPLDGIGPDELTIERLRVRLKDSKIKEVIVATNPTVEGEATAIYLNKVLTSMGVKVTRIARGLPVGGDIEYADDVTISRAIEGRRELG